MIAHELAHLAVPIGTVIPDPANVRKHGKRNLAAIKESLARFGQVRPLRVWKGTVVAGNGTLACALDLGWTEIAVEDVSHLTQAEVRAFAIVDNKAGALADWDFTMLSATLQQVDADTRAALGFTDQEAADLLHEGGWEPEDGTKELGEFAGGRGRGHKDVEVLLLTPEQAATVGEALEGVAAVNGGLSPEAAALVICDEFLAADPAVLAQRKPTNVEAAKYHRPEKARP